jgi:hypothetical protein
MPKNDIPFYSEVQPVEAPDPMTYTVVPPLDEYGDPIPPSGKSAAGDKRGAAADSKEK